MAAGGKGVRIAEQAGPGRRIPAHRRGRGLHPPGPARGRTQPSPFGPDRELVDYRDSAADPLDGKGNPRQVTGNEWANQPASWPEYDFVGDTYAGFLEPGLHVGFRVADASAWVFAGTGLRDGEAIPAVVASDVDKFDQAYGQPADDQIFGHSPVPARLGQTSIGAFFSDMTYYTNASASAGVLDTGTNNWIPALHGRAAATPAASANPPWSSG